jgi:tetratricopeptide (TPR) repeat protein
MSNESVEQRIEKSLKSIWANFLSAEEYQLAFQIYKEIDFPPDDLPFDTWRERVTALDQDFQNRLSQAATPQERSELRFACLLVQNVAGAIAINFFQNLQKTFDFYQCGLDYANAFLQQGETRFTVRKMVLTLYANIGYMLKEYANIGYTLKELDNVQQAFEYYQRGLKYADDFFKQGETSPVVRMELLLLYLNTGYVYGKTSPPDIKQELKHYQRGIAHIKFLKQSEITDDGRNTMFVLYLNAGVAYGKTSPPNVEQQLEHYQRGIAHAETFLKQGEITDDGRETVLSLCLNAGITYGETSPPNVEQALTHYQRGIAHAETFLKQGKISTEMREIVCKLYGNYLGVWKILGHTSIVIPLLPTLGLWTWVSAGQAEPDSYKIALKNWNSYLKISLPPAYLTAAFQTLLHSLVLDWHSPQRSHRHFGFISTKTLLEISEGLYALAQAEDNRKLQAIYQSVEKIALSDFVKKAKTLQDEQLQIKQDLDTLQSGDKPSFFDKLNVFKQLQWLLLEIKRQDSQQRIQQQDELAKDSDFWQQSVKAENKQVEWLKNAIHKHIMLPPQGLEDLSTIALGVLLASHSVQAKQEPEMLLETWLRDHPPWQDVATLRTAFAASDWQTWAKKPDKALLSQWTQPLEHNDTVRRLKFAKEMKKQSQTELQGWLRELLTDNPQTLPKQLSLAWHSAQIEAKRLAPIFAALADVNFQGNLFTKRDYTDIAYREALAAIILGDAAVELEHTTSQVEKQVREWLKQQFLKQEERSESEILNTFNRLKHRFMRATTICSNPHHSQLEQVVHNWAKALLTETLQTVQSNKAVDLVTLWDILERARMGLSGLTLHLPKEPDLVETLGESLWEELKISIICLSKGHKPKEKDKWYPLETWLKKLKELLPERPPVEQCQQHLNADEALVQPFVDPSQQRLRVLWLDKRGLKLRDLPNDCAEQHLWVEETEGGVIAQWTLGLQVLQELEKNWLEDGVPKEIQNWTSVIESEQMQTFANTLTDWAMEQQLKQLTVIFPASLGQLPWEAVEQLEDLLVREVSVNHWFNTQKGEKNDEVGKNWVVSDPSGEKYCMVKEGDWVAKHLCTTLENSCPSVFDALRHFTQSRHIHLATHGKFIRQDPTASYLTLEEEKDIRFPLWMSGAIQRVPANFVMLSACESNLYGRDTEGLLIPIGIGPSLAAAGAKTVVGTLWPCEGLAALLFSYHFYTIAEKDRTLPWHQVAKLARKALKEIEIKDLKKYAEKLSDQVDECNDLVATFEYRSKAPSEKPFNAHVFWAGFTVLGQVARPSKFWKP